MIALFKRLWLVVCTGFLLAFYSELLFWARPGAIDAFFALTIIMYSLAAFVLLDVIRFFRVRSVWALFLAGAVFGWVIEGMVAGTLYGAPDGGAPFPISISFTGLAWHALITVLVGWYGSFLRGWRSALLYALVGAAYGFWAIMWWIDVGVVTPFVPWLAYTTIASVLLIVAIRLRGKEVFRPSWAERILVWGLLGAWWFVMTMPKSFIALTLPLLLGIAGVTLWKNRRQSEESMLEKLAAKAKPPLLTPLLIPVTGGVVYGGALTLGISFPTNWVIYLITMPAGFVMLFLSVWKIWRAKRPMRERR